MQISDIKVIKHLSTLYKVVSAWCRRCRRHRYHSYSYKREIEADILTITHYLFCLKCQSRDENNHTVYQTKPGYVMSETKYVKHRV